MNTKLLDVFYNRGKDKLKVGKLAFKDRTIYFEYDKDFLNTRIELSPYKLPLKSGVHICEDNIFDGLFGVFDDSLPDGWGKLLIDRYLMNKRINFKNISPLDRMRYKYST